MKRKYIRQKYEMHKFAKNYYSISTLYQIIELISRNDYKQIYETLLQLFAQNVDLMTPIEADVSKTRPISYKESKCLDLKLDLKGKKA
jgi:hypothetical protein